MAALKRSTIVDFVQRRAELRPCFDDGQPDEIDRVRWLARQLGETIANAADADQWTTFIEGVDYGGYTFRLPPRPVLRSLNGGRRGTQEVSIPLGSDMREIGSVRLLTIRPQGFDPDQLEQARAAAECAGRLLARAIDRAAGAEPLYPVGVSRGATVVPLHVPTRHAWSGRLPRPCAS